MSITLWGLPSHVHISQQSHASWRVDSMEVWAGPLGRKGVSVLRSPSIFDSKASDMSLPA